MQKFGETPKLYCKDDSNNIQVAGHTQMTVTEVSVLEPGHYLQSATAKCHVNCRFVQPKYKTTFTLTLILRRSRTGTVWFYTSTSNKRAARP